MDAIIRLVGHPRLVGRDLAGRHQEYYREME